MNNKIIIHYVDGSSWTYRGEEYFIDGFVDWGNGELNLMKVVGGNSCKLNLCVAKELPSNLTLYDVLAVEWITDNHRSLSTNPNRSTSVKLDVKTCKQRQKEVAKLKNLEDQKVERVKNPEAIRHYYKYLLNRTVDCLLKEVLK